MRTLGAPKPARVWREWAVRIRNSATGVVAALLAVAAPARDPNGLIRLNDDGGWCWFEDERAVVTHGRLVFGTIAAGVRDPQRQGDVEVTSYDLKTGKSSGPRSTTALWRPIGSAGATTTIRQR